MDAIGQALVERRDDSHACRVGSCCLSLGFSQLGPTAVLVRIGDPQHAIELHRDAEEIASGSAERLPPGGQGSVKTREVAAGELIIAGVGLALIPADATQPTAARGFRALAHHLRITHAEVRARVVTEMHDYKQRYVDFAEQWDVPESGEVWYGCSYDEFVDRMAEQGEWGLNTTLKAAANAFKHQLHIVSLTVQGQSYYQTVIPEDDVNNNEDLNIWLAFLDGCHYRATKNLPGKTFSVPADAKEEEFDIFPASILRLSHTQNSMRPMRHYCYDQRGHKITFKEDGMIKDKMTNEVVHSDREINCYCGQVYWAWSLGQANDWSREKTLHCLRMIMMGKYEFDMRREEIYRESGRTVTIHDVVRDDDSWQLRRVELKHFISDQWFVTISSGGVSEVSNDDVPLNEQTKEYEEPFFHIHHVPYDVQEGVIWTHSLHRPEKISLPPVESCCQMLRRVVCDTNLLKRWYKWIVGKCSAESDDDDVNWQHGVEMHDEEEKKEQ